MPKIPSDDCHTNFNLIRRLEAGETGREISDECLLAIGWEQVDYEDPGWPFGSVTDWINPAGKAWLAPGRPHVTESLDAAIAHMVPEWHKGLVIKHDSKGVEVVIEGDGGHEVMALAPTAAGAMCAAGLMARGKVTHLNVDHDKTTA